jgi:hypothetical protein
MPSEAGKHISAGTRATKSLVVDAIVVPELNLDVLVDLQNVLAYLISCLDECASGDATLEETSGRAKGCTEALLRTRKRHRSGLSSQTQALLRDSVMESEEIVRMLTAESEDEEVPREGLRPVIEAKAYKVRYLGNILLAELARLKRDMSPPRS